ncbi:sugar transferase [Defluviimonas sp. WL0024]|uniref:Sugar transferase n=1 Tax=Albidovulum salinarum TaxID=2984153 RepID=A0ABT2X356_9RHOB|nr:sugar transferase [Defluviimonas sp. WL0024]MCU9848376.1 sugar transferase [Defluviimonas sp. WL0024]
MTTLRASRQPTPSEALSRALDLVLATVGVIVLAPLMLLITIAILLETGRPILFAQVRLGKGGKRFWMYKFRKFGPNPATQGCPLTVKGDPRMTRVGRVLEATKLDELPQLFNILRGEMAFVGPRPESLDFADCFEGAFLGVLEHRPGIFGPSQVAFRSEADLYPAEKDPTVFYRRVLFPTKATLDLQYYPNRTTIRDIGWLLRGVLAVLGATPAPASNVPLAGKSVTKAARRRAPGRGTGRRSLGSLNPEYDPAAKRIPGE